MNGPQHFREAERLLSNASFEGTHGYPVRRDGSLFGPNEHEALIARAQIHATLALAAAVALAAPVDQEPDSGMPPADATAWHDAAGVKTRKRAAPDPNPSMTSCTCGPTAVLPCGGCRNCDRCEDCGGCNGTGCTCACEAQS